MHWVDPKPLLRVLLYCHSHCSYCQRGLREGCDCPGAPCPVQADLVLQVLLQYCEQQWECALCSTQVGWCLVSVSSHLWPGSGCPWVIPGVRVSLCSALVSAGMATKLRRGDTASGCRQCICYLLGCSGAAPTHHWLCGCTWHLYQLLTISLVTIQIKSMLNSDQLTNQETTII